jgi:phenylalanine-4-hydroxylase
VDKVSHWLAPDSHRWYHESKVILIEARLMASTLVHPMFTHESWHEYTPQDHTTWRTLYHRQEELLKNRAAPEIIKGMDALGICSDQIPTFDSLNEVLAKATGFKVIPVKGLVSEELFFQMLSQRQFPSTCFIRKPEQMDYLEEPDIFHDVFGHVPLLINPVFADFMESFGRKGLEALSHDLLQYAARLYWFTVEFGLIQTDAGLRIYGAGITSSSGESIYCLESDKPARIKFNLLRLLKTVYHVDSFQKSYFVVNDYETIIKATQDIHWPDLAEFLRSFPDIDQGIYLNEGEKQI